MGLLVSSSTFVWGDIGDGGLVSMFSSTIWGVLGFGRAMEIGRVGVIVGAIDARSSSSLFLRSSCSCFLFIFL